MENEKDLIWRFCAAYFPFFQIEFSISFSEKIQMQYGIIYHL